MNEEISNDLLSQNLEASKETEKNSQAMIDGFTETSSDIKEIKETLGENTGWFYKTLSVMLENSNSFKEKNEEEFLYKSSMAKTLEEMSILDSSDSKEKILDKKKQGKISKSSKLEDLAKLPWAMGTLGAVLVNAISSLKDNNNEDKKKKSKGGKGKITGFFKGLMEGVSGISGLGVALMAFAGASMLFNLVKWDKAILGMSSFAVFLLGMIGIAKLAALAKVDFEKFSKASITLVKSLVLFTLSLYLVSEVFSSKGITILGKKILNPFSVKNAILGLSLFVGFLGSAVLLARLLKNQLGNFKGFVKASMMLSASLILFTVSMYITSEIVSGKGIKIAGKSILPNFNIGYAILGMGIFLSFIGIASVIAKNMKKNLKNFKDFAIGSLVLVGALITFSIAIWAAAAVFTPGENSLFGLKITGVSFAALLGSIIAMSAFVYGIPIVAEAANKHNKDFLKFLGTATLISASIIALSMSIWLAGAVFTQGENQAFGIKITGTSFGAVMTSLGSMLIFLVTFGALGAAMTFLGEFIVPGLAMLLLFPPVIALLALSIGFTASLLTGGEINSDNGNVSIKEGALYKSLEALGLVGLVLAEFSVVAAAAGLLAIPILVGMPVLMSLSKFISYAALAFSQLAIMMYGGSWTDQDGNKIDLKPNALMQALRSVSFIGAILAEFQLVASGAAILGPLIKIGIKNLNPLVTFITSLAKPFALLAESVESLKSLSNSNLKDSMLSSVSLIKEMINTFSDSSIGDLENFEKNMKSLGNGSKYYKEAITNFSVEGQASGIETMSGSLEKLGKVNLSNLDKLSIFSKDSGLKEAAEYISQIAQGMEKISKQSISESLSSFNDKSSILKGPNRMNFVNSQSSKVIQENKKSDDEENEKILKLLEKWDKNGLRVFSKETANREKTLINI